MRTLIVLALVTASVMGSAAPKGEVACDGVCGDGCSARLGRLAGHGCAAEAECGGGAPLKSLPPLSVTNLKVRVGARRPFRLLHVSDSHLSRLDSRSDESQVSFALARSRNGREWGEYYLDAAMNLAGREGVAIVHTGDIMEFASPANLEAAGRRLRTCDAMACPGNHEYWLSADRMNVESNRMALASALEQVFPHGVAAAVREIEGVSFFVFDNASGSVSRETAAAFERTVLRGCPIVMVCHVPLQCPEFDDDVSVCKGEFVERARREPLVKAVLTGHVHRRMFGRFSPTADEFVVGALFDGCATMMEFE